MTGSKRKHLQEEHTPPNKKIKINATDKKSKIDNHIENNKHTALMLCLTKDKDEETQCPGGSEKWTMSQYAIYTAIKNGKADCLQPLLTKYSTSPWRDEGTTMTHFAVAVAIKEYKTVCLKKLLIDHGKKPWSSKGRGWSITHFAIFEAAEDGSIDCLQQLLAEHGDLQWPGEKECWNMIHYAIWEAARSGNDKCLIALLSKIEYRDLPWPVESDDDNSVDVDWTMCHYAITKAIKHGQAECLKRLLTKFGNSPWPGESAGWTLNHYAIDEAAEYGQTYCLKAVLTEHGDKPWPGEVIWKINHYVIYKLIEYSKPDCLKALLLDHSNKPWPGKSDDWTLNHYAIHEAAKYAQTDCLKELLLDHGEKPWPEKSESFTLYHYALNILMKSNDAMHDKLIYMIDWLKDKFIADYKAKDSIERTKKQIETLLEDKDLTNINPKLHEEFYEGIFLAANPHFYQAITISPMSLYCELQKMGTPLKLPLGTYSRCQEAKFLINKLTYISEHLNFCFLWNYPPLSNLLNKFIDEYNHHSDYNHQTQEDEDITNIICQTHEYIEKLVNQKKISEEWNNKKGRPRKKYVQTTMLFHYKRKNVHPTEKVLTTHSH